MIDVSGPRTHVRATRIAVAAAIFALAGEPAVAHVKWFCAFDVAGQPRGLENVLCADFELLVVSSILLLICGALVERLPIGASITAALDRVSEPFETRGDIYVRAVLAFFFIALWTLGGIILTPELKTDAVWISWLQLAIAAGMLWRRTLPLSALGIVTLYVIAVAQYGSFHLADYPIFLGVAVWLLLTGTGRSFGTLRPVDVLRIAASITLMWASIEKWAYPQWSYDLFNQHQGLNFGLDPDFYMRAAGVVEFTLAFALLWTPMVRRIAATLLIGFFISACFEFGKIDVIGHAAIIIVLVAIACDTKAPETSRLRVSFMPAAYSAALVMFLAAYYGGHRILFGASLLDPQFTLSLSFIFG
jgi:hypothetical protein